MVFRDGKKVSTVPAIPVSAQTPDVWPDTMATPRAVVSSMVGLTSLMSNMVATTWQILSLLARPPDTNNCSGISMSDLTRSLFMQSQTSLSMCPTPSMVALTMCLGLVCRPNPSITPVASGLHLGQSNPPYAGTITTPPHPSSSSSPLAMPSPTFNQSKACPAQPTLPSRPKKVGPPANLKATVEMSPELLMMGLTPTLVRRKQPVPMVTLDMPGLVQQCPTSAACWSPMQPVIFTPTKLVISSMPNMSPLAKMLGMMLRGTP